MKRNPLDDEDMSNWWWGEIHLLWWVGEHLHKAGPPSMLLVVFNVRAVPAFSFCKFSSNFAEFCMILQNADALPRSDEKCNATLGWQ